MKIKSPSNEALARLERERDELSRRRSDRAVKIRRDDQHRRGVLTRSVKHAP